MLIKASVEAKLAQHLETEPLLSFCLLARLKLNNGMYRQV